jgi:hypothetical protein
MLGGGGGGVIVTDLSLAPDPSFKVVRLLIGIPESLAFPKLRLTVACTVSTFVF